MEAEFGWDFRNFFEKNIQPHVAFGNVIQESNTYSLTLKGKLFADKIASDCFKAS
jgi:hypothetical protein